MIRLGVPNYLSYTITEHAQDRIQTRFNIPKKDLDSWVARLMSQGTYDETQENGRKRYHLNDIVFILDPKTKNLVTVYTRNSNELGIPTAKVNPEVQSMINQAIKHYKNAKRVKVAKKISEACEQLYQADQKMLKRGVNYRHSNKSWGLLINAFDKIQSEIDTATTLMREADTFKGRDLYEETNNDGD